MHEPLRLYKATSSSNGAPTRKWSYVAPSEKLNQLNNVQIKRIKVEASRQMRQCKEKIYRNIFSKNSDTR